MEDCYITLLLWWLNFMLQLDNLPSTLASWISITLLSPTVALPFCLRIIKLCSVFRDLRTRKRNTSLKLMLPTNYKPSFNSSFSNLNVRPQVIAVVLYGQNEWFDWQHIMISWVVSCNMKFIVHFGWMWAFTFFHDVHSYLQGRIMFFFANVGHVTLILFWTDLTD